VKKLGLVLHVRQHKVLDFCVVYKFDWGCYWRLYWNANEEVDKKLL